MALWNAAGHLEERLSRFICCNRQCQMHCRQRVDAGIAPGRASWFAYGGQLAHPCPRYSPPEPSNRPAMASSKAAAHHGHDTACHPLTHSIVRSRGISSMRSLRSCSLPSSLAWCTGRQISSAPPLQPPDSLPSVPRDPAATAAVARKHVNGARGRQSQFLRRAQQWLRKMFIRFHSFHAAKVPSLGVCLIAGRRCPA